MPLFSCQDVTFAYENNVVVKDLSFTVESGDYLCIVGENGAGKTTLLKGLAGLIKPTRGSILTGKNLKPNEIGYLPQQSGIQKNFPASVLEVVLSGRLNRKRFFSFYGAKDRRTAEKNLERMGVSNLKNRTYSELSGGQQQRVLLARALCATEKLVLLDEPTAGLDPYVANELVQLINGLNRSGITVVMISHDVRSAVENAGKILHLRRQMVFWGSAAAYADSEVGRRYLGAAEDD